MDESTRTLHRLVVILGGGGGGGDVFTKIPQMGEIS